MADDVPEIGRKVPADLEAESALLGSMMLSSEAVRIALEALDVGDWYNPAHRRVFASMAMLAALERPIDPVTVAAQLGPELLDQVGGRRALLTIQARTPASANAGQYARLVAEAAARRRAIAYASALEDAAYGSDDEALAKLVRDHDARLATPTTIVEEPGIDVVEFVEQAEQEQAEANWAIRDVLDVGEVVLLTGGEGSGKTTLMRQLAVQAAIGRHPWQRTKEEPRRVLYVDLQDPPKQIRREFGRFLQGPGRTYERGSGLLAVKARPQGMDLTTARDARWLDALVAHHDPALVCLGPLYRAYRGSEETGSKSSEEAADVVTDVLARLLVRRGCALILEGHTIHDGEKVGYRPRGSRLWEGWPTFGFGLAPSKRRTKQDDPDEESERSVSGAKLPNRFRLVAWRGMRDRDRPWPEALLARGFSPMTWPWEPPDHDVSTIDTTQGTQDEIF